MTDAHDMISRKAAIEAVQEYLAAWDDIAINGSSLALVMDAIAALPSVGVTEPTDAQTASACMSYRHDFGLLDEGNRASTMFIAREWLRAWRKEFDVQPAPDVALVRAEALREAADLVQRIAKGYRDGGDEAIACGLFLTEGNIRSLIDTPPATSPDVALVERAILDAQLRCMEQGRIDTPEEIRAAALAMINAPPAPSPNVAALAEARAQHIASVAAYNAKLELVKTLRAKGDWSQNALAEANAMHETRSEFVKAAQEVADAALARKGG